MFRKFINGHFRQFNRVLAASALIAVLSSGSLFSGDRRPLEGLASGELGGGEYLVRDVLTVPAGDTFRVGAGAALYFEQLTGIDVLGVLSVCGEPGRPVVMTSADAGAGGAAAARAFDWNGVRALGPGAAVFMRHASVGNSVYGVNIGDTLSRVELREVVFSNNGYASLVRGGEIVPVAEEAAVNAEWNADAPPPVKRAKVSRGAGAKFIVNASAMSVAAAGMTVCYIGLSNTNAYHRHYTSNANAAKLSEYYQGKISKNITVSAVGAIAAGVGLSCMGVTLFF